MTLREIALLAISEVQDTPVAVEDFGTSAGAKKGWLTRKGAHREQKTNPHRDSLGELPDFDNLTLFSPTKNQQRGTAALTRALNSRSDVKKAMFTKELGWVDFDWGSTGPKAKDYKGGWGISHILAKHGQDVKSLPETIAHGECYVLPRTFRKDGSPTQRRFCVVHPPYIAFLDNRGRTGSFCVSEYQKSLSNIAKYRKNPRAEPRILS